MLMYTDDRKNKDQENIIKELTTADWILALLAYANGELRGKTRLQKALFLLQEEVGVQGIDFKPYKFGPYAPEIDRILNKLLDKGLIEIKQEPGGNDVPVQVIRLTEKGALIGNKILHDIKSSEIWSDVKPIFDLATKNNLVALLAYVYTFYPEWSKSSEIRSKVRRWQKRKRLFFLY